MAAGDGKVINISWCGFICNEIYAAIKLHALIDIYVILFYFIAHEHHTCNDIKQNNLPTHGLYGVIAAFIIFYCT